MRNHYTLTASRLKNLSIAVGVALISGCTVGPNFTAPTVASETNHFESRSNEALDYVVSNTQVSPLWWSQFNDPILSQLAMRAQRDNLDYKLIASRIEQSRARLGITTADYIPQVSLNGSYTREDISDNSKFAALGAKDSGNNYWQTGFDASWEIDIWGHIKRAEEGAIAELKATILDQEAFKVSLMANVAQHYLLLRGTQNKLRIIQQTKDIAAHTLALVKTQADNGLASRYDVAMARAQLASIDAQLPTIIAQRNAQMNGIAMLLGEAPRALDSLLSDEVSQPTLPKVIPIGIPSELAKQRPDVLSAQAMLHQATAAIGVAKSNFYPRITLVGRAGLESFQSDDLTTWASSFFGVGPAVYLPIFQGGKLQQRLKLTEEKQKRAAIEYRKTVLNAWHEIDEALDGLAFERRHHFALENASNDYQQALHFAERRFEQGAGNYIDVLSAQRNVLDSQLALSESVTNTTLRLVTLYKSLGGGWNAAEVSDE